MAYLPGGGRSGPYLMQLWRRYLEEFADREGSAEEQVVVGAYHAAEILGVLTEVLDRGARHRRLIEQRTVFFRRGAEEARLFADCLVAGTFTIYNHLNTMAHLLTEGNKEAGELIQEVDRSIHLRIESAGQLERAAAALNAAFPLLGLATLALDRPSAVTDAIRQVERRFIAASAHAVSAEDQLLNGLYRLVEMMQLFAALSDEELQDQAYQIASRFEEEDRTKDLTLKMRNGFCRLFELAHLVVTRLDDRIGSEN